jgi:uncharacterized protein YbcI
MCVEGDDRRRRVSDTQSGQQRSPVGLLAVSNALVALHKEQFGRGPTRARTNFAGPDALVCVLDDALLPAERAMVEMGEHQRVRESRMWFQTATSQRFIDAVEDITGRAVRSFASATDPEHGVVMEIFVFESQDDTTDGNR